MTGPSRGGGVKGRAIKEKITFFWTFFGSKISTAIMLEGGGGLGLYGPAIFFLPLP